MTEDTQQQAERYYPLHQDEQTTSDQQAPVDGPMGVWRTLGALANRVKAITGRSTFRDDPPTNLTEAKAHHDARSNPHNVTRAQLGAAAQTALDSHIAARDNPHGVTAQQAGARPSSYVPSWSEITSKPSTYPSTWTQVADKPQVFAPTNHKERHHADGLDPLTAANVGAAPASHVGSRDGHPLATQSANGLQAGADKSKLDSLAIPPRIYVAPSWPRQDITVTTTGWQSTLLAPEVTVPALGNPPSGFAWLIDVVGSIRFRNMTSGPAGILIQIQYNRAAVGSSVDGGNSGAREDFVITPLTSFGMTPPSLTAAFTVNFYMYTLTTGSYNVFQGPLPTVRVYLVKV